MHKTTLTENFGTHQPNSGKVETNTSFPRNSFRYIMAALPFALILLISTSYQRSTGDEIIAPAISEAFYFSPEIRNSLKNYLESDEFISNANNANAGIQSLISDLYASNGYKPVWLYHGLNSNAKTLINIIEHARELGLEPQNYNYEAIRDKAVKYDKSTVHIDFGLETLLSDAAFRLMINLHSGYRLFDSTLYSENWAAALPKVLLQGLYSAKTAESILSVEPQFIEYRKLRKANELFVKSHTLNDDITEIRYPQKDTVSLMSEIREALVSLGYIGKMGNSEITATALKVFQQYHGLIPDGKPGLNTIEALRKTTLYRYKILALNLDRLRKNQYSDSMMLYVNIPAYQLKVYDGRNMTDIFRVIVGNPATPTPIISGNMEKVIANPVWFVPRKIAVNEILPKLRDDSTYLTKNGFKVLDKNNKLVDAEAVDLKNIAEADFDYTFRQNRGTDNSLGQVKFLFSNPYSVYLHDTPGKALFQKDLRAFSHGCVRVEHPEKLAACILTKINSDTTEFRQYIATGQQHEYTVNMTLPVRITYVTCEADEEGRIYFYKDIYGVDNTELADFSLNMGI